MDTNTKNKQFDKIKECLCQKISTMDNDTLLSIIRDICPPQKIRCTNKGCAKCWCTYTAKILKIEEKYDEAVAKSYELYEKRCNAITKKYGISCFDEDIDRQEALACAEDKFVTSRNKLEKTRDKALAKLGYYYENKDFY